MFVFPSVRERCAFLRRPPRVIPRTRTGLVGVGKGKVTSFDQRRTAVSDDTDVALRPVEIGLRYWGAESHKIQGTGMTNCQRKVRGILCTIRNTDTSREDAELVVAIVCKKVPSVYVSREVDIAQLELRRKVEKLWIMKQISRSALNQSRIT